MKRREFLQAGLLLPAVSMPTISTPTAKLISFIERNFMCSVGTPKATHVVAGITYTYKTYRLIGDDAETAAQFQKQIEAALTAYPAMSGTPLYWRFTEKIYNATERGFDEDFVVTPDGGLDSVYTVRLPIRYLRTRIAIPYAQLYGVEL